MASKEHPSKTGSARISKGPVRGGGPEDSRSISGEKVKRPVKGPLRDGGTRGSKDTSTTKPKERLRGPVRDGSNPPEDSE